MAEIIETIGYHGTTRKDAETIIREQRFIDSETDHEWLGAGVYFFEYKTHAVEWTKLKRFKSEKTTVVKARLLYREDQLLDLDNPDDYYTLKEIVERMVLKINRLGKMTATIDLSERKKNICYACNLIRDIQPEIGIIIYTFSKNNGSDFSDYFFPKTQRQICVSDHSIIHNIELEGC